MRGEQPDLVDAGLMQKDHVVQRDGGTASLPVLRLQ